MTLARPAPRELADETAGLLRALIRLDTTNPPGNETAAAALLARYLEGAGVPCRRYARDPARANLVARLRGTGDGPTLLLLSHTDVVAAAPEEWSVPPFAGVERDGAVWGRGALDMKGQAAAGAVALATLARAGWRGRGDVVLCAVADEEEGTGHGLEWLVEAHPDAVRADYAINEGGGERLVHGDRVAYTVGVGEKASATFTVTVHGRSGHAASPMLADNAIAALVPVLRRLVDVPGLPAGDETVARAFAHALTGAATDPRALLDAPGTRDTVLPAIVEPMLAATVTPTRLEAGTSTNIVPHRAQVTCDARLPPGLHAPELRRILADALRGLPCDVEVLECDGGSASPLDTPLRAAIDAGVAAIEPGARVAPVIDAFFTDSHWLREAFGTVAYGFMPRQMDPRLARSLLHGADERALRSDLGLAAATFVGIADTLLGG